MLNVALSFVLPRHDHGQAVFLAQSVAGAADEMIAPLVGVVLPIIHKTDRVTYKLKLNHGDLKATQGDTGHAEIDMITKVYAHILDEDRKINAQKFESAFYANPDLRNVKPPQEPEQPQAQTLDLAALVEQLQKSPELASTLAALLTAQKAG